MHTVNYACQLFSRKSSTLERGVKNIVTPIIVLGIDGYRGGGGGGKNVGPEKEKEEEKKDRENS